MVICSSYHFWFFDNQLLCFECVYVRYTFWASLSCLNRDGSRRDHGYFEDLGSLCGNGISLGRR